MPQECDIREGWVLLGTCHRISGTDAMSKCDGRRDTHGRTKVCLRYGRRMGQAVMQADERRDCRLSKRRAIVLVN
jgi:hypothetical protein